MLSFVFKVLLCKMHAMHHDPDDSLDMTSFEDIKEMSEEFL